MLLETPIPKNCAVREVEGVPAPGTSGTGRLACSDGHAVLRYDVAPNSGGGTATVTFANPLAVYLGWPNDEALNGHRLCSRGLRPYSFQEVFDSDWVAEIERGNRVHPNHLPAAIKSCRHFVITFQDETFECVAGAFEVSHEPEEAAS